MARRAEETSTLQVRTRVLNGEWDVPFRTWYQGFRAHAQPTAAWAWITTPATFGHSE